MGRTLKLMRKLLRIPPPRITSEQALTIAIKELARIGDSVIEIDDPEQISLEDTPYTQERLRTWDVIFDYMWTHQRVMIIDNQSGEVLAYLVPPR